MHSVGMTEAMVQRQIIDGLKARGAEVVVTHNAKRKPVTVGVTDLIAILPGGRALWIEVKGEGGTASEEQLSFNARLRALGHTAIIARGWDDCERHI